MSLDIPVFKKCCCLSLRHGLIVWGVLKVLTSCLATIVLSVILWLLPTLPIAEGDPMEYVFLGIALIIAIIDLILSVVLVIGCVKEKVKLVKKYYTHCKCIVPLILVSSVFNLVASVRNIFDMCHTLDTPLDCALHQILDILLYFAFAVFHVYIMLLVRSEILELENNQLKNANNATDTEANIDDETNKDIENK